jgi:hypothetical protein
MSKTAIKIGPADNGRRMSLEEFEQAEEHTVRACSRVSNFSIEVVFHSAGLT